jgi:hypothetical protein
LLPDFDGFRAYKASPRQHGHLGQSNLLRLDPMFDLLRNDLRFQILVASPTPK